MIVFLHGAGSIPAQRANAEPDLRICREGVKGIVVWGSIYKIMDWESQLRCGANKARGSATYA